MKFETVKPKLEFSAFPAGFNIAIDTDAFSAGHLTRWMSSQALVNA